MTTPGDEQERLGRTLAESHVTLDQVLAAFVATMIKYVPDKKKRGEAYREFLESYFGQRPG